MYLFRRWRSGLVAIFLVLSLFAAEPRAESYGDTLQVALPVAALGCSFATGEAAEYAARYAAMWLSMRLSKLVAPESVGTRPSGGAGGFPSGHTSSAAFGASALVFSCLGDAPALKTAVVLAAAFTGGSRLEVRAHDVWQVFAAAIWGIAFERALRRPGPLRRRVVRLFRRRRAS